MSRRRLAGSVVLCLLLSLASLSFAQSTAGKITGTVTDPSGAVVSGATVTVTDPSTGVSRTATTGSEGTYSFAELPPGTYSVAVSKSGFKTTTVNRVALHVSDITTTNVKLALGGVSENVTVEAAGNEVNTENGEVSNVVRGEQVRELPLNGRSFVQLTTLVPGASVGEGFDPKNKGLLGAVDISFSGSPAVNNQWTVDGANNNDVGSNRTILIYPSVDGIEEFKILRNSYGPEYGGGSAQITIATKGGTNSLHGDAYYFGRNDAINAKNFFLGRESVKKDCATDSSLPQCRKQLLRRNDWGYTIGGPIKKDKIFFFWSQEWNHERRGAVRHRQVPTTAMRNGDYSAVPTAPKLPGATEGDCGAVPLDPETGQPFPGNIIPANRLSPGGQAYIAPMPLPTEKGGCDWVNQVKIPINWREENIRGDWNVTKSTSLMMKYTQDAWVNATHAYPEGGLWGDSDFPALSDNWSQPAKSAVAKLTTTLGGNAVNTFQFSWSGNRINISRGGDNPKLADAINTTEPRLFPLAGKLHGDQVPWPIMWTGTTPSGILGTIGPWNNRQDLFSWRDDFSKIMGKHSIKVGFFYDRNAKDEEVGAETGEYWGGGDAQSPAIDYKGPGWTAPNFCGGGWGAGCGIGTGNYYADYILKGETFGYDETKKNNFALVRWRDYEFYVGDTWKLHRRLTVDLGVRWSWIQTPFLADNTLAGYLPSLYNPALNPVGGADPCNGVILAAGATDECAAIGSKIAPPHSKYRSLVPDNNHLIQPRFGIAWDVFGDAKFVLRAGVGQFYSRDRLLAISMRGGNTPFAVSSGGSRTFDGPLTLNPGTSTGNGGATPANCNPGCAFGISVSGYPHQGLDPSTNRANSWQWNVTTEMALPHQSKFELAWVANRGIHLHNAYDANQIPPNLRLQAAQVAATSGSVTNLFATSFANSPQIIMWAHKGDSIYHSLQSMFSTKFGRASTFQATYTWSKNIGTTTFGYVGTGTIFADNANPRGNRGPVDFDRPHVFSANLVYGMPTLAGSNGFVRGTLGGWEVASIYSYATGPALTITGTTPISGIEGVGNSGQFGHRPLRDISQPCHAGGSASGQWLNPLAFTFNGYKLGTFGNSGPGQCYGPPINNLDFALDKNFALSPLRGRVFGENPRLQLRFETFNLLNHPQFRFNGQNLAFDWVDKKDPVTGVVIDPVRPVNAAGGDCRPAPTTCTSIIGGIHPTGSNFGQPQTLSAFGNREIQYAIKIIW